ncbi:MAG: DsbA family protein [Anaerolineales bacterium]
MLEDPISQEPIIENLETVEGQENARSKWIPWLAAGGCAVLVCAALFIGAVVYAGPQMVKKFFPDKTAEELLRGTTSQNTMGDPNAPIHIIEYGDFQCPYCLKFWQETEPQLIKEYVNTGKVYFEFRSFPIIGPESVSAAEGAYCAGDQGKFWEYHDTLFTNWTGENMGDFTQEKLIQYADSLSLDTKAFEKCLSDGTHRSTVEQDKANGDADNVHATPTFFINGNILEGSQPFDVMKHIIEEILNGNLNTLNG